MIDPSLVERFDDPPAAYGPTPLWWWSGGTVTEDGIDDQLQRFVDGGVRNLVVMNLAPKGPTYGAMPDDPEWFSERWWQLFAHTCRTAAERGLSLWFYDQIGFSGANLQGLITAAHPDAAGRSLRSHLVSTGADGRIDIPEDETLIGAFDREQGADGGWRRHEVEGARAVSANEGDELRVVTWRRTAFDYLSVPTVARLIDFVHGEFERRVPEHIGTTIVGSFQDELPAMPTWSADFAERFLADAGYDLEAVLPALWDQRDERSAVVRADYHRVRTALAEEAFFRPLGEWHRDRGMLIGADQTNPARSGAPTQSAQLYGDYFATHRWFDAVGSDHEGDARVHSSMADLYDHPRVWIEAFHSSGWGGTLEDTWDWLIPFFAGGANLYNPHASYYSLRAGWFEWAPPSTDFRQPYSEVYPQFAKAVARVSAMLTWGRHQVDVGVLHPGPSIRAQLPPDLPIDHFLSGDVGDAYRGVDVAQRSYRRLVGRNDWFRAEPGLLDRAGLDFDVLDGDSIDRGVMTPGAVDLNGHQFRVIIVPELRALDVAVATRLAELLDVGGRVVCVGAAPFEAANGEAGAAGGRRARVEEVRRLAEHPRLEVVPDVDAVIEVLSTHQRFASSPHGARVMRDGDTSVALLPAAAPNATAYPLRTDEGAGGWDDIDFDPSRYASAFEVRLPGAVAEAELWNPATGERRAIQPRVDGGHSIATIETGGAPLVALVWTEHGTVSEDDHRRLRPSTTTDPVPVPLTWTQTLVPTLDNRTGDFALPAGSEVPLEIWTIERETEAGDRQPVRVTFGQELLVTKPQAAHRLPRPLLVGECAEVRVGSDLGGPDWAVQAYSAVHGRDSAGGLPQDPKGFVEEEFFVFELPEPGEEVGVRALIRLPASGEYELTVAAICPVRAWVDGVELDTLEQGFDTVFRLAVDERVFVLELRFSGIPKRVGVVGFPTSGLSKGSFAFARAGERVPRPEFMLPGTAGIDGSRAVFRREFTLAEPATSMRIVAGSSAGVVLRIDGRAVAQQAKVEYYESGLGALPRFFTHRLGAIDAGEHVIEAEVVAPAADTSLFIDLVAEGPGGTQAVVSGRGWTVGSSRAIPELDPVSGLDTTYARAAVRPHPLRAAHWLSGEPAVGVAAVPFESAVDARPRSESFSFLLPVGTEEFVLSADVQRITIDGVVVPNAGRLVRLAQPLEHPSTATVILAERVFSRGGAAWEGPIVVRTMPCAPAVFDDWSVQGLSAWSGAVRYATTVEHEGSASVELDLGRVRGAVTVDVDGERRAEAFCAPYRFRLDGVGPGRCEIAVTVYGTLAPRYASATQSAAFVPSQLRTGPTEEFRIRGMVGDGSEVPHAFLTRNSSTPRLTTAHTPAESRGSAPQ